MDCDLECVAAILVISSVIKKKKCVRKKEKTKNCWIKLCWNRRNEIGVYNNLLQELRLEDEGKYKTFLRMTPENH